MKDKGLNLIIDINSHSVGGALVIFSNSKQKNVNLNRHPKPQLIFSKRLYYSVNHQGVSNSDIHTIIQNIEKLIKLILKEKIEIESGLYAHKRIKTILCVVSAPWCVSNINTIYIKKERPIDITPKIVEELARRADTTQNPTIENNTYTEEYKTIEKKILQTKFNGYLKTLPFENAKAKEIEISIFEGKIYKDLFNSLISLLDSLIFGDITIIHSFTLGMLAVIEEMYPDSNDYILVEVTRGTTELTWVKNGLVANKGLFNKGKNLVLDKVASEFNVNEDVALSFIKLYNEKKSEKEFEGKIDKVMKEIEEDWKKSFKMILEDLTIPKSNFKFLPKLIYLSMNKHLVSLFTKFIQEEYNINSGIEARIISLGDSAVGQFCEFKNGEPDSFLALESVFLEIINEASYE